MAVLEVIMTSGPISIGAADSAFACLARTGRRKLRLTFEDSACGTIMSRAEPSRAEPSRAEPSRAEPSRVGLGRPTPGLNLPLLLPAGQTPSPPAPPWVSGLLPTVRGAVSRARPPHGLLSMKAAISSSPIALPKAMAREAARQPLCPPPPRTSRAPHRRQPSEPTTRKGSPACPPPNAPISRRPTWSSGGARGLRCGVRTH